MGYIWKQRTAIIKPRKNDSVLDKIMKIRGYDEDEIDNFLMPDITNELPWQGLKNIEKAVEVFQTTIFNGCNIVIAGDPDADGITSLAVMHNYLREFAKHYGAEFNVSYTYSQREDGHGISTQIKQDVADEARKELNEKNRQLISDADLLIIVDSSSSDIKGIEEVLEMNEDLKIIILDHHQFEDEEAETKLNEFEEVTLVNPHQSGDTYENKDLSGAGVVYKFIRALDDAYELELATQFLDLVAVGLVGDVMSMASLENRYYVSEGLLNVKNIGLTRILKGAKVNVDYYCTKDIGFSVAPLLNGASRMGQIELAIEIFLVEDDKDAKPLRLAMDKLNKKQREVRQELVDKYKMEADLSNKVLIVVDNDAPKGYSGIVAQNLAQEFQRPCFVVRDCGDLYMGSGRSYGDIKTRTILSELDYVVTKGHEQSHGIEFPKDKLNEVIEHFNENIDLDKQTMTELIYDIEIVPHEEIGIDFAEIQNINKITGNGFPEVKVLVRQNVVEDRAVLGQTKETVKFTLDNELVLIKFKVSESWYDDVDTFDEVSVIGTPNINVFYNFKTKVTTITNQIIIEDIHKEN